MDIETRIGTKTGVMSVGVPKEVAKITICGALQLTVTDTMKWIPPTEEQKKNLKEMLCIDIEILE